MLRFAAWCERRGVTLDRVEPVVVAAHVEEPSRTLSPASVKQHLAALRMLFDWLVVGQVLVFNPAGSGYVGLPAEKNSRSRGPDQLSGPANKREPLIPEKC